jgi:hypothetical protein
MSSGELTIIKSLNLLVNILYIFIPPGTI